MIEDFKIFIEYVNKKGIVAAETAKSWNNAVSAVVAVLEDDEKTLEFVANNSQVIKNRLQNQNTNISGTTIETYIRRASLAFKNSLEWKADRAAWERRQATKPKPEVSKERSLVPKKIEDNSQQSETKTKTGRIIPIPAISGEFSVTLPSQYKMSDLVRVVWALAVYAEDFDPAAVLDRFGKPPATREEAE